MEEIRALARDLTDRYVGRRVFLSTAHVRRVLARAPSVDDGLLEVRPDELPSKRLRFVRADDAVREADESDAGS